MKSVLTVGWLYAWRWVAAMTLGGFEGWSLGMLFSGDIPLMPAMVNVIMGLIMSVLFSVLYYLERKAGTEWSIKAEDYS